jgi:hypothetical protein
MPNDFPPNFREFQRAIAESNSASNDPKYFLLSTEWTQSQREAVAEWLRQPHRDPEIAASHEVIAAKVLHGPWWQPPAGETHTAPPQR